MIKSLSNSCSALHEGIDLDFARSRSRQGACGTRRGPARLLRLPKIRGEQRRGAMSPNLHWKRN